MSAQESERLRKIRWRAKNDYYFFCKEILGYSKMTEVPHREVCEHIRRPGKRKKLSLLPRNSFKSSVITIGNTLFSLLNDPNERILIASETQRNATKYLKEMKGHIEQNEAFRSVFGDLVGTPWRDFEFTIKGRTRVSPQCSVTAASMEKGVQVGMHYSTIVLDDVVSKNNVNNKDQIQKTLDYYRLLLSILDPGGKIYINGTRWHLMDLYGWIIENEQDNYDVLVKKAEEEDGTLLMPTVLSREFLDEQKKTQGLNIYNAQYLNNALSSELQTFRPEWIQYYDKSPDGLIYFITIDLAITQSLEADYTAIIVNGVDFHHRFYVQEALQIKCDFPELIQLLFTFGARYQPLMCIGMQKFQLEKALKPFLNQEMERRKIFFPVKEVPTDNRVSKEARIKALQPKFESRSIFLKKEHQDLVDQIILHPQCEHDDLLDALKDQMVISFPSWMKGSEPDPDTKHLSQNEKRVWDEVRKLGRKVRPTKMEIL